MHTFNGASVPRQGGEGLKFQLSHAPDPAASLKLQNSWRFAFKMHWANPSGVSAFLFARPAEQPS